MKTTENFEANNHAPRKSYSPDSARLDASTHETGRPHDALQPDDDAQESASRFGSKKGEQTPDTPRVSAGRRIAKPVRNSLILLLLILLTAAGLAGWRYVESYQSTDDAEIDGHIHEISSRIQGSVARVSVEDNQHVKKGQALSVMAVPIAPTTRTGSSATAHLEQGGLRCSAQPSHGARIGSDRLQLRAPFAPGPH